MSKNVVIFDINMSHQILSKTKAKELKALSTKKERDRRGLFIAEGEKCVRDLSKAFYPEILICTVEGFARNSEWLNHYSDAVVISDKKNIEIISSFSSLPDIIGVFRKNEKDNSELYLDENKLYVLLDEIQDPGNLGTIIRTCDWFGIYEIFASENTVDVYGPKVVQSTMGSLSRVKVHYTDLINLVNKNRKLKLIGTLLKGKPLKEIPENTKGLLLMGNEGRGISDKLKSMIDLPLTIPPVNIENHPDSLNVAVTTAIILSHLT